MRLLIVGATGRTGQQVTAQALKRGHGVTVLVRRASLSQWEEGQTANLRVVVADPCNTEELSPVLAGQDAVISCLGHRPGGNPWLVRDAARAMLGAMQKMGVKRYLTISGALLFPSYNPLILLLKTIMAERLEDARAMESAISAADVDWTVVRPPHLREGDSRKGYRIKTGARPRITWGLQFRDLAECLLDLAEEQTYLRQVVGVASA